MLRCTPRSVFARNRPEVSFGPCSTKADKHVGRQKLFNWDLCHDAVYILVLYTRISGRASHLWYGSLPAPYLITVYVKLRESKIETNAFNVIKVICIFCIKYICKVVGSQISIWNLGLVLTRSGDDELRSGRLFRNCVTDRLTDFCTVIPCN